VFVLSIVKYANALVPFPGVGYVPLEQIADIATNPTGTCRFNTAVRTAVIFA
jgi:hypothetical protein